MKIKLQKYDPIGTGIDGGKFMPVPKEWDVYSGSFIVV